jgi:hypothetical protein
MPAHQVTERFPILSATTENFDFVYGTKPAHDLEMSPRLTSGTKKSHHGTIFPCQLSGSYRTRDRCFSSDIVIIEIVERYATDNHRQQFRGFAVVRHVDAFARGGVRLIFFRVAMPFVMDKRAGDSEVDAAARMDIDPAVTCHHALARQTELWVFALIAKTSLHGIDGFFNSYQSL